MIRWVLTPTWMSAQVLAALAFGTFGLLPVLLLALSQAGRRKSITARHGRVR